MFEIYVYYYSSLFHSIISVLLLQRTLWTIHSVLKVKTHFSYNNIILTYLYLWSRRISLQYRRRPKSRSALGRLTRSTELQTNGPTKIALAIVIVISSWPGDSVERHQTSQWRRLLQLMMHPISSVRLPPRCRISTGISTYVRFTGAKGFWSIRQVRARPKS